jgi:hypothetical protein
LKIADQQFISPFSSSLFINTRQTRMLVFVVQHLPSLPDMSSSDDKASDVNWTMKQYRPLSGLHSSTGLHIEFRPLAFIKMELLLWKNYLPFL